MTLLLIIFAVTYGLIATERVDKTVAAILGAAAAIAMGYLPYEKALEHVDLNVIFLLTGMMMIVNVMAKTGLFEWVAIVIAQKARGNAVVILMLFLVVTAVFSAFLDNVTTVILIAPITILITQILEVPTIPFLTLEAIFSNIGGTATLVGDPPNILIGSREGLSFNDFLVHLTPIVGLITVIAVAVVLLALRKRVTATPQTRKRVQEAQPALAIIDPGRMKKALGVFALVLLGFFFGHFLHIDAGLVALAGGFLMVLICGVQVHQILEKVEWATIFFFAGLFMLVGALQENGVFEILGRELIRVTGGNLALTAILLLWVSAIVSSIVDNIPLVIAMIPLIESTIPGFAMHLGLADNPQLVRSTITEPLFWSLALGACLGGNGSLIGASANVVIAQIARKNKYHLTFWTFTQYGFPLMVLSLIISTFYIYFRYFQGI